MFTAVKPLIGKKLGRILRFAIVGFAATATHATTVLFLVERNGIDPLWANFFAFLLAVIVSFVGHYHWTFTSSIPYTIAFPKFFISALLGLCLNQMIMFCTVSMLALNYQFGLAVVVTLVPVINFLINSLWTFQPVRR